MTQMPINTEYIWWFIRAMEYFVIKAKKMSQLLLHTTSSMTVTNIMLSKRCQTQSNAHCVISLVENSKDGKTVMLRSECWLHLGRRERAQGKLKGCGGIFHVLNWVMIMWVCSTCEDFFINDFIVFSCFCM